MLQNQLAPAIPVKTRVTSRLSVVYAASLVIAIILTVSSVIALLNQNIIYPTEELRQSAVVNDLVNLVLVLPILLGSMWLAHRGRWIGLLFWPGALFVVFYNAIAAVIAVPVNVVFLLNLLLVASSVYTMGGLLATIDAPAVQQRLTGAIPERPAGGILMGLGLLFILFVMGTIAEAMVNQTPILITERALHIADFMIAPAWVIGGLLLWRRQAWGYAAGVGMLFQGSMLFVGLLAVLALQPLLTTAPFVVRDFIAILIMALVCFIPFALVVRGVWLQET